jgi:hypothetical protein
MAAAVARTRHSCSTAAAVILNLDLQSILYCSCVLAVCRLLGQWTAAVALQCVQLYAAAETRTGCLAAPARRACGRGRSANAWTALLVPLPRLPQLPVAVAWHWHDTNTHGCAFSHCNTAHDVPLLPSRAPRPCSRKACSRAFRWCATCPDLAEQCRHRKLYRTPCQPLAPSLAV